MGAEEAFGAFEGGRGKGDELEVVGGLGGGEDEEVGVEGGEGVGVRGGGVEGCYFVGGF